MRENVPDGVLKSALGAAAVVDATTGDPVSATGVVQKSAAATQLGDVESSHVGEAPSPAPDDTHAAPLDSNKRDTLKILAAFFSGGSFLLSAVNVGLGLDRRRGEKEREGREQALPTALAAVFPFLVRQPHKVRFFPNADNQLLVKRGIGFQDATILDNLPHGIRMEVTPSARLFFDPTVTATAKRLDRDVYSVGTLRESHVLRSALCSETFEETYLDGAFQFVRQPFDPAFTNVVVGSPTGNRFSALLRGKYRRPEPDRKREMIHEGVDGLRLPFEFSLDRDADPQVPDPSDNAEDRWILYEQDAVGTRVDNYIPERLVDYFIVSVLPNHANHGVEHHKLPPVVLLEGCTSLGTSGLSVLWTHESAVGDGPLRALTTALKPARSRYWQALFTVVGVGERKNERVQGGVETFAREVSFEKLAWVIPDTSALLNHSKKFGHSLVWGTEALRAGL